METAQTDDSHEVLALRRVHRLVKAGRLTQLREEQGLSQSDVGRFLGVSPSNVSRWEAGVSRPRGRHAVVLLGLLDRE
jgi:DNA-binding transcriptional regulator YiaG